MERDAPALPSEAEKRPVRPNTCSACEVTWTGLSVAHCAAKSCHRTFAGVGLFDAHRTADGRCLDPEQLLTETGRRRAFFRDGMWRGPEMTEEQRAKLRSVWGGEAGDPIPA